MLRSCGPYYHGRQNTWACNVYSRLWFCFPNPAGPDRYFSFVASGVSMDERKQPFVVFHPSPATPFPLPAADFSVCCSFNRGRLSKREADRAETFARRHESTPTHNDILIKPRRWPSRGEIQSRDNKWSWPNTFLTADEPTPRLKQFTPFPCARSEWPVPRISSSLLFLW